MWHATYTQRNQGHSRLLMVENQIGNLTPIPSFGHNLCFNYSNGSCEPILDIHIPKSFQWYKELFNPMGFNPLTILWKFGSPSGFQLPKWELTWSVEVHSFTFSYILRSMKCDSQVSLLACTFASPCFGCEPKTRVATSSTVFTFFTSYEIKHWRCGDECNFNKVRLCCILMCWMIISHIKSSWSKGHPIVFELHFLMLPIQLIGHVYTRAISLPCLQKPL